MHAFCIEKKKINKKNINKQKKNERKRKRERETIATYTSRCTR